MRQKEKQFAKQHILLLLFTGIIILLLSACSSTTVEESTPETAVLNPTPTAQSAETTGNTVRVGILTNRSLSVVNSQWGPLMDYLGNETGDTYVLVPLNFNDLLSQVERKRIDFVFANPLVSTQAQLLYDTELLATLAYADTGSQFGGLIIVQNDSDIETLDDLRGRTVACVDFKTAAGGCTFQIFHLLEEGIDPFVDLAEFTETGSQDNVVFAVLNGTVDAGFIRTGQLEAMVSEGTIMNINEVGILAQAEDDYVYPHTTQLYPEWAFAATNGTDTGLTNAVSTALLNLPDDHPVLETAGVAGFVAPLDYTPIVDMIKALNLPGSEVE